MKAPLGLSNAFSRAAPVRVQGVLNPLLWLAAVASTDDLIAAALLRDQPLVLTGLVCAGIFVQFAAIGAFVWFMVKDPDRLDSEAHRRAMHKLLKKGLGGRPARVQLGPVQSEPEALTNESDEDGI